MLLACRYVARSDEQKEGLISLFFNFETGALIPQASDLFSNAVMEAAPLPESVRATARWERILQGIARESKERISEEIRDFQDSMNRRLRRDVNNLEEYYENLKKEMELSLGRAGLSDRLVQDRKEKIALIPDELAKKKEDLLKKYSIRIKITPCAGLLIRTPAVKILCEVHIGREKKPHVSDLQSHDQGARSPCLRWVQPENHEHLLLSAASCAVFPVPGNMPCLQAIEVSRSTIPQSGNRRTAHRHYQPLHAQRLGPQCKKEAGLLPFSSWSGLLVPLF